MENSKQIVEQKIKGSLHRHECYNLSGARHQVMIYPTWAGITDFERGVAKRLNSAGLSARVVDFFGSAYDLTTIESRREAMSTYTQDFSQMTQHLGVLNEGIRCDAGGNTAAVSVMGFCLGGMCALLSGLTQQGFASAISFHGLLSFPKATPPADPATRFLILNGNADPMVPGTDIRETQAFFESHQLDLTFINFSRTRHSFSIPGADNPEAGVQYNPRAAERSWRYATDMLAQAIDSQATVDAGN
ncbi:hypothetical protein GCM10009104_35770 [Marinobacterium maritimum]|uniref:Dienelactone hydrolase domain-containing protein n=1 Tax=Marinobacterium maritimum TaxID=500162 RepID=A0ABN1IB49_9GAMM